VDNLTMAAGHGDGGKPNRRHPAAEAAAPAMPAARMLARARRLMIVSGLTTLIAMAAVITVIGYRVFRGGGSETVASGAGVVMLPKGARVIGTAMADGRIAVTLDIAGVTEIRTFDAKTLKEIGRIRFATEP
jgi:hypothetical protein